jgi:hypothetical protein
MNDIGTSGNNIHKRAQEPAKKGEISQSELSFVEEPKGLASTIRVATSRTLPVVLVERNREDPSFVRNVSILKDKGVTTMMSSPQNRHGTHNRSKRNGLRNMTDSNTGVRSKTCPSLFGNKEPMIHTITCQIKTTVPSHPIGSVTAIVTAIIFYYVCFVRRRRRAILNRLGANWRTRGDYAQVAVFDELLDDFNGEDLSSYMNENDDDDDSIGTIISEWSQGREGLSTIELSSFDDEHIAIQETNG